MKKILVSSALSALLVLPAAALQVYENDGTSLDVYGSIRGYVGMGENAGYTDNRGNFLFGVQGNSHIGFNVSADKFKAKVEFGANEPDASVPTLTPLRFFWGSYNTGLGTILVGKANTPTTDIFSTGVLNTDTALNGFGGLGTSTRRLQLQYNIAGLSLALISDYLGESIGLKNGQDNGTGANTTMPRIALSYTLYGDGGSPLFQVAGTYKRFNSGAATSYNDNGTVTKLPIGKDAWHISVGTKPTFGNNFVSLFAHYGKNQHFYGETNTFFNGGNFGHSAMSVQLNKNEDVKRSGVKAELGIGLSKDATFTLGAGYQQTFGDIQGYYNSIGVFAQVPYKVSANFVLTPVVGWFQTAGKDGAKVASDIDKVTSAVGAVRVMWNF
ncbi:hypothetical protein [Helicobacter typhlonius]|uniref:hypothetical protein n=1 Tax=Helicobacter typhlonius TaxID=76936 RepID=UPI002FE36297